MAINWDMYADSGRNVASGLGSLMDLSGISAKAKNRAALDQKFSSLASLGSPETGAMTGLPLRAERDRQPTGPAPEQFAGNPQPAQQFDGPMGGFSNKDLIEIIRNPEASDGERAMVLDEYKRRTTPKDPYAERMKALELKKAEYEASQLGKPGPAKWGVVGQDAYGNNQYGWIDEASRSVSPLAPMQGGQPLAGGTPVDIPAAPPGVDPKIWRQEYTKLKVGEAANAEKSKLAKTGRDRSANIVVQDIDRALSIVEQNPKLTTGLGGFAMGVVPGTDAYNVRALTDTIKANASFDKLQAMRDASPTGGALGGIAVEELKLLSAAMGNLETSQSPQQFSDNLRRFKNIYLDIIHGPGNGPPREPLGFDGAAPPAPAQPASGGFRILSVEPSGAN